MCGPHGAGIAAPLRRGRTGMSDSGAGFLGLVHPLSHAGGRGWPRWPTTCLYLALSLRLARPGLADPFVFGEDTLRSGEPRFLR